MFPAMLNDRVDALIDDLIMNGGVEAASVASILLAAKDAVKHDYHVTLTRRVWSAVNDLNGEDGSHEGPHVGTTNPTDIPAAPDVEALRTEGALTRQRGGCESRDGG